MKCKECGKVFNKKDNQAVRISGEKITVCPNCGHEEILEEKKIPNKTEDSYDR